MANQYLALSLFIMMLSFFIILNALSNFDPAKAAPVIDSLSIAFANKDIETKLAAVVEEDTHLETRSGDGMDQIDALFKTQMSGVETQKNRFGTVMNIRLKIQDFEQQILAPARKSGNVASFDGAFLPVLVSLLKAEEATPYRMDMVLNVRDEPAKLKKDAPEELRAASRKVGAYAQALEGAGLPIPLVTAGLRAGDPAFIDLFFYRHEPFDPIRKK